MIKNIITAFCLLFPALVFADLRTHLADGMIGGSVGEDQYLLLQIQNSSITSIAGNVTLLCTDSDPLEEPTSDVYFSIRNDFFSSRRRGNKTFLNSTQTNGGEDTTGLIGQIEIAIMSGLNNRQVPRAQQGQVAIVSITASRGTKVCGATTVFRLLRGRVAQRWLTHDYGGIFASLMRLGNQVGYLTFGLPVSCVSNSGSYMDIAHVRGEWVRRSLRLDGTENTYQLTDTQGRIGDYSIRLERDGTVEIGGSFVSGIYTCTGSMILQTIRR
jgi:hypothetical protein